MFSSFSSHRTLLTAKRRKVSRACDFCRQQRVRCEDTTPCPQCVASHVSCSRSQSTERHTDHANQSSHLEVHQDRRTVSSTVEPQPGSMSSWPEDPATTDSSVPQSIDSPPSQKADSMVGFVARIDNFCSGVSQLSAFSTLPGHAAPQFTSPFPCSKLQEACLEECNLEESQINRLLLIFWTRLWPQVPIVSREDLKVSNQEKSPLRDAVIAYCMQHIYYTGLHTRLLGLDWKEFQGKSQESMIGLPYFQRCLRAATQWNIFSQPSLVVLQCYCFMTLYLLDAGQHQAAYNMIGLALRIAQSLDPRTEKSFGARHDAQLFCRIWWTLNHLDFRCARHLGKPVSIRLYDSMCSPPPRDSDSLLDSNSTLFHTESIRLTAAALAILESTGYHPVRDGHKEASQIEAQAQLLSNELHHLHKWRTELQHAKSFQHLNLAVADTPVDPNEEINDEGDYLNQTPLETLLTTILSLQYHNIMTTLHRVFIQFPSHPLLPKSSPLADAHNATALNHALTTIRLTHRQMAIHDILHGVSEVYQYQWNAVLTLVGFMLAYPYCHRCPRAREYIRLALEIFDSAGSQNTAAARAAALTRHLCDKVDALVRMLNLNRHQPPANSEIDGTVEDPISGVDPEAALSSVGGILPRDEGESSVHPCPEMNGDSLWSWVDLIDVDAWPSYCDEVSEAFTDPLNLPLPWAS